MKGQKIQLMRWSTNLQWPCLQSKIQKHHWGDNGTDSWSMKIHLVFNAWISWFSGNHSRCSFQLPYLGGFNPPATPISVLTGRLGRAPTWSHFRWRTESFQTSTEFFWGRHVSYWCCDMLWHSISSQMSHASQMVQKVWSINHSIPRWTPQKAPWGLTILWLWHFGYQQRSFKKNMSCQTCETKVTLELQTLRTFTQATLWNTISPGQHNWFKPASLDRACFFKVPDDFDPHRPHYPDSSADLMTTNCDENSLSGGNGKKSIGR